MMMPKPKPLFLARLAGTQAEMGAQHGRLVANDAVRLLEFYRTMPERALVGDMRGFAGKVGRGVARGLATAWQARLAKDRPAELADRSRAFVEAVLDTAEWNGATAVPNRRTALLTMATMDSLQNCVSLVARTARHLCDQRGVGQVRRNHDRHVHWCMTMCPRRSGTGGKDQETARFLICERTTQQLLNSVPGQHT